MTAARGQSMLPSYTMWSMAYSWCLHPFSASRATVAALSLQSLTLVTSRWEHKHPTCNSSRWEYQSTSPLLNLALLDLSLSFLFFLWSSAKRSFISFCPLAVSFVAKKSMKYRLLCFNIRLPTSNDPKKSFIVLTVGIYFSFSKWSWASFSED